ncbi:MAG: cysteine hydrolase, partial [Gammaproteobacteria bacterium]|nr:cysteine hydrolase [Gammaproteobacteria bacterium]
QLEGADGRPVPPEVVHAVELAALKDEFATVKTTAELVTATDS